MASTYASGSQTATLTTEHTLSSVTAVGQTILEVDLNAMAAGDETYVTAYKMVRTGGTSRPIWSAKFNDVQPTAAKVVRFEPIDNDITDTDAVKYTLLQAVGTGRAYPWAVLQKLDALAPTTAGRTLNVNSSGEADADVKKWLAQGVAAAVNGFPKVDLTYVLGTILTEGAGGRLAAAFIKWFNVASPTGTVNSIPDAIPGASNGLINFGTGTGQLSPSSGGVDVTKINGSATAAVLQALGAAGIVSGAATTGTLSTTQMSASALTSTHDDQYNGRVILWTSGALIGVVTTITDYTNTGRVLTFDAVHTAPSNADTFIIL